MAVVDQYLSRRQLKNLQISLRTAFCVLPKENRIARCFLCTLRFKYENGCHVKGGGSMGGTTDELINMGLDESVKIVAFFSALKFEWETSPSQPDFLNRAV